MVWLNKPKDISNYMGFIYLITNKLNGKKYVGKKKFWFKKTLQPLKGRKNKRRSLVESDWETYWGSCKQLLDDIKKHGEKNFTRKILKCYKTTWECNYYEAKYQFDNDVLLKEEWYNDYIGLRLRGKVR